MKDISETELDRSLACLERADDGAIRRAATDLGFARPTVGELYRLEAHPETIPPNRKVLVQAYFDRLEAISNTGTSKDLPSSRLLAKFGSDPDPDETDEFLQDVIPRKD